MSLYHEGAEVLVTSSTEGGSLKSRVFGRRNIKSAPGQLYALVLETCKWSAILKEVIEASGILSIEKKLTPALALLLAHDLLLAKGGVALPKSHGLRLTIEKHRARLASELTRARLRRTAASMEALTAQVDAAAGEEKGIPRWVRVNTIKSTVHEQLETTFRGYEHVSTMDEVLLVTSPSSAPTQKQLKRILIDPHIPNLVAVTPGIDLTKTEAYGAGKIILQDKASCFPAYLLDPRPDEDGSDIVDACAAPGNKTTHLAAICHARRPEFETTTEEQGRGPRIFAFEKDKRRAQTLVKMLKTAGAHSWTRVGFAQDFCRVDPAAEEYKRVGALLLDPSCSGSGIVGRDSMPELHFPSVAGAPSSSSLPPSGGEGKHSQVQKEKKRKMDDDDDDDDDGAHGVLVDDEGNETVVRSEQDLDARLRALAGFQLKILMHALRFPAARRVTYSTCSVHAEENERVAMAALGSAEVARRGWRVLRRAEQVRGLREWPVRGKAAACGGDEEVAEACIRSYRGDGRGVMGFFVVGFVRDGGGVGVDLGGGDGEGPYVRDRDGRIVRDVLGMPVSKATGRPVELVPRDEEEEEEEDESEGEGEDDWGGFRD